MACNFYVFTSGLGLHFCFYSTIGTGVRTFFLLLPFFLLSSIPYDRSYMCVLSDVAPLFPPISYTQHNQGPSR